MKRFQVILSDFNEIYNSYNLHNSYNVYNLHNLLNFYNLHNSCSLYKSYGKVNFSKHIKKLKKHCFINFFLYIKILTENYQKTNKDFKKRLVKGIKIFLNRLYANERYRNLLEDEQQRLVEHRKFFSEMQKNKDWLILLLMVTDHCIE